MEIPLPTELGAKEQKWFGLWPTAGYLAVLLFLLFPQVFLGWETFVFRDYFLFGYPLAFHGQEAFWQGEIPLWNPLNHCGIPFAAQWVTMVFYPGSLFYLLLPLKWALGVFTLVHLWWGGVGMYALCRHWKAGPLASCLAAVVMECNGLTLSSLCWPHYMAVLGWMPWVVLTAQKAWREGGRKVPLAALTAALQMLAGAPEILLFTWLTIGFLWLADVLRKSPQQAKIVLRFLLLVILVAGLIAIQLLPFLELLRHSQRDRFFDNGEGTMPPTGWANFLVPLFGSSPLIQNIYFQHTQTFIPSYYTGIAVVLLGLVGLAWRRTQHRGSLIVLIILGLTLPLGQSGLVYPALKHLFPAIGAVRFPVKMVYLILLPVCYGTAMGWELAGSGEDSPGRRRWWWGLTVGLLAVMAGVVVFAFKYPLYAYPYDNWRVTALSAAKSGAWLVVFSGLLLAFGPLGRRGWRWHLTLLVLVFHWLDILTHRPVLQPTVTVEAYAPGVPSLDPAPHWGQGRAMLSQKAHVALYWRALYDPYTNLLCNRLALNCNLNLLEDYASVLGFYPLMVREANDIHNELYSLDSVSWPHVEDFLGVIQTSRQDSPFDWTRRSNTMPLLTGGQAPWFVAETNTLLSLFSGNLDLRRQVVLPETLRSVVRAQPGGRVEISQVNYGRQLITATVKASVASLVVVAQTYYPAWRAYVDGKPVPLWRANHAYQALEVPTGEHEVRLAYEDRPWRLGMVISLVTLGANAIYWVWPGRPTRGPTT